MSAAEVTWLVRAVCCVVLVAGAVLVPFGLLRLIRAGMPAPRGYDAEAARVQLPGGCGVAGLVGLVMWGALLGGAAWGFHFLFLR